LILANGFKGFVMTTSTLIDNGKPKKVSFRQGDLVRYVGTINGNPNDDFVVLVTVNENNSGNFHGVVVYTGPGSAYNIGVNTSGWSSLNFERYYGKLELNGSEG
jgi:hypothetical protein